MTLRPSTSALVRSAFLAASVDVVGRYLPTTFLRGKVAQGAPGWLEVEARQSGVPKRP